MRTPAVRGWEARSPRNDGILALWEAVGENLTVIRKGTIWPGEFSAEEIAR
jgi:hypothetical protein